MSSTLVSRVRNAQLVSMAALYINGILYATWGVNIPVIREKFSISEGELSIALAAVAMGGIVTMGVASQMIYRYGSRLSATLSGLMMAICASTILLIPQYSFLLILLILFGIFTAANDIALNTQVSSLERLSGKSLIGALHASFSAGGLTGALLSGIWRHGGLGDDANFWIPAMAGTFLLLTTCHLMVPLTLEQVPGQINETDDFPSQNNKQAARKRLIIFGSLAFLALVVEGALYDWSAVYMLEVVRAPVSWSGYGYATFSLGLISGRLSGDTIRGKISHQILIISGWIISLFGLTAVLLNLSPISVLMGFLLMGAGISNIIPLLFSSSAKLAVSAGLPASEGLAITTRIGYVGLLAGPLIIGPVAEAVGLKMALITVGLALSLTCGGWLLLSARTAGVPWVLSLSLMARKIGL